MLENQFRMRFTDPLLEPRCHPLIYFLDLGENVPALKGKVPRQEFLGLGVGAAGPDLPWGRAEDRPRTGAKELAREAVGQAASRGIIPR